MRLPLARRLALLLALALAGCSGLHVGSDYDPEVDFTGYGTYAWIDPPEPSDATPGFVDDDLLTRRIRRAVNDTLVAKGLRETPEQEAGLLVTAFVSVVQKVRVDTVPYGYGYGRWGSWGGVYTETQVTEYEEGTLVIDLVDADKKELVWRGTARSRLKDTSTPEQRDALVREVVAAVLERYPPASPDDS